MLLFRKTAASPTTVHRALRRGTAVPHPSRGFRTQPPLFFEATFSVKDKHLPAASKPRAHSFSLLPALLPSGKAPSTSSNPLSDSDFNSLSPLDQIRHALSCPVPTAPPALREPRLSALIFGGDALKKLSKEERNAFYSAYHPERLEFVGDRLWYNIIAETIFILSPVEPLVPPMNPTLKNFQSTIVRLATNEMGAKLAKELGLSKEAFPDVLPIKRAADVFEAYLAALLYSNGRRALLEFLVPLVKREYEHLQSAALGYEPSHLTRIERQLAHAPNFSPEVAKIRRMDPLAAGSLRFATKADAVETFFSRLSELDIPFSFRYESRLYFFEVQGLRTPLATPPSFGGRRNTIAVLKTVVATAIKQGLIEIGTGSPSQALSPSPSSSSLPPVPPPSTTATFQNTADSSPIRTPSANAYVFRTWEDAFKGFGPAIYGNKLASYVEFGVRWRSPWGADYTGVAASRTGAWESLCSGALPESQVMQVNRKHKSAVKNSLPLRYNRFTPSIARRDFLNLVLAGRSGKLEWTISLTPSELPAVHVRGDERSFLRAWRRLIDECIEQGVIQLDGRSPPLPSATAATTSATVPVKPGALVFESYEVASRSLLLALTQQGTKYRLQRENRRTALTVPGWGETFEVEHLHRARTLRRYRLLAKVMQQRGWLVIKPPCSPSAPTTLSSQNPTQPQVETATEICEPVTAEEDALTQAFKLVDTTSAESNVSRCPQPVGSSRPPAAEPGLFPSGAKLSFASALEGPQGGGNGAASLLSVAVQVDAAPDFSLTKAELVLKKPLPPIELETLTRDGRLLEELDRQGVTFRAWADALSGSLSLQLPGYSLNAGGRRSGFVPLIENLVDAGVVVTADPALRAQHHVRRQLQNAQDFTLILPLNAAPPRGSSGFLLNLPR